MRDSCARSGERRKFGTVRTWRHRSRPRLRSDGAPSCSRWRARAALRPRRRRRWRAPPPRRRHTTGRQRRRRRPGRWWPAWSRQRRWQPTERGYSSRRAPRPCDRRACRTDPDPGARRRLRHQAERRLEAAARPAAQAGEGPRPAVSVAAAFAASTRIQGLLADVEHRLDRLNRSGIRAAGERLNGEWKPNSRDVASGWEVRSVLTHAGAFPFGQPQAVREDPGRPGGLRERRR